MELARAILGQFLLFTALLTPLELLWPSRAQKTLRRGVFVDLAYFVVSPLFITIGTAALLAGLATAVQALLPVGVRAALSSQPWTLQLVEIVLGSELLAYGAHVAAHRVPLLWRFHSVHHSAVELDWLAAHRQHPVEAIWLLGLANVPALALGFSMEPLLGFVLFQKVFTAFLHANVRTEIRGLTWLVATPRFHRWHHDGDDRCGRNFAGFLPILDRIFGTYALPDGEPARLGTDEPVPSGYLGQLWHPFRPLFASRIARLAIAIAIVLFAFVARAAPDPEWKALQPGVELARIPLEPGGKPLLVVRIDPNKAKLKLALASARDRKQRTAGDWCKTAGLSIAINAGMYRDDHLSNVGHLVDGPHVNSAHWVGTYQSVLALDPTDPKLPAAAMLDLDVPEEKAKLGAYRTVVQNLRLIKRADDGGHNMWKEQGRRWSEAAVAVDGKGRVLFLFSRTPYSMADLNRRVLALPLGIQRAMHVEGGPEASLSIHAGGIDEDHFGSYETGFVENDGNDSAWEIPNVLGVVAAK